MEIESAFAMEDSIQVIVDGHLLISSDKQGPLKIGYAFYLLKDGDEKWLRENGDIIPADPIDGRAEYLSHGDIMVTSNPILVALAINSQQQIYGYQTVFPKSIPIPDVLEAVEIVRNRRIDFIGDSAWAGYVPGLEKMIADPNSGLNMNTKRILTRKYLNFNDYRERTYRNFWEYKENIFKGRRIFSRETNQVIHAPRSSFPNIPGKTLFTILILQQMKSTIFTI